jgi:outer membrane protein assembly factor BamA
VISVVEGPVYQLAEVTCTGDLAEGEPRCLELLGVRKGDVFSRSAVVRGVERVRELQAKKGRGTQIEPSTTLDSATHTVKLTIHVSR